MSKRIILVLAMLVLVVLGGSFFWHTQQKSKNVAFQNNIPRELIFEPSIKVSDTLYHTEKKLGETAVYYNVYFQRHSFKVIERKLNGSDSYKLSALTSDKTAQIDIMGISKNGGTDLQINYVRK